MTDYAYRELVRRGVICAACCLLLLAAGCSNRRSEQFRGEGDTLLKLGRVDEARNAYLRSEETNPANPMAQLGLARCAAADGEVDAALSYFEEARTLAPDLKEPYSEAVRLLAEAERIDEALELAAAYQEKEPLAGGLLYSAVLLNAKRPADAAVALEKLQAEHPDSDEVAVNLGVAYAESDKPERAESLLLPLSTKDSPFAPAARMALIEVYQAQGKLDELVDQFAALVEANPESTELQLGYARTLLVADRPEEAEAIARTIIESDPSSGWGNYIVGSIKMREKKFEEAAAFLEVAAVSLPENKDVAGLLDAAKSGTALPEPAVESAPPAETVADTGTVTWRDLWKQAALERLLDGRQLYLAEGGEDVRDVLVLAAIFNGDARALEELTAELPETSPIAGMIAALETGDAQQVSDYFAGWNPDQPDRLLMRDNALGYAMAAGGARGNALSVFLYCLERWPDNAVALYNIAQVFRAINRPVIAAQQLQRIILKYPENIDAHQMLYSALREGKAFDQARKAAEASYSFFPEEKWSTLALSQAYLDTGEPELALQVLGRAASLYPDDPEVQLAMGGILVRLGDCERAVSTLSNISSSAPPINNGSALLKALCAIQEGDWPGVLELSTSVGADTQSDSLRLLASIGHVKQGDLDKARQALEMPETGAPVGGNLGRFTLAALGGSVEGLSPEEQEWATQLGNDHGLLVDFVAASALQMADLYDAAWTYYGERLASQPPNAALARLAFSILEGRGNSEEVLGEARKVAESLGQDARVWLGLAGLLERAGDEAGHLEALQKAQETGPDNPEVWFRQAMTQEKQGDFSGAVESYRKLLTLQPESATANNNLAYMLLQVGGHDEEALEKARIAQEKRPTNPGVLHTLGLAQMRTGDLEGSKVSLIQATEIDPASPTIMYDYGRVLLKLGNTTDAQSKLRYALAMSKRAGIDFPEMADAERLLTDIQ